VARDHGTNSAKILAARLLEICVGSWIIIWRKCCGKCEKIVLSRKESVYT
jgi:hypothetical protein